VIGNHWATACITKIAKNRVIVAPASQRAACLSDWLGFMVDASLATPCIFFLPVLLEEKRKTPVRTRQFHTRWMAITTKS
jgi:hypothetical protein